MTNCSDEFMTAAKMVAKTMCVINGIFGKEMPIPVDLDGTQVTLTLKCPCCAIQEETVLDEAVPTEEAPVEEVVAPAQ